jgi:hypothetical protein
MPERLWYELQPDGTYQVNLAITATTYVSSMHLIDEKRKQLLNSIHETSASALQTQ